MDKQIVHTTSLFEVDSQFEDSRFMRVRVTAMHSGINRNNSRFSINCIKAAKDSFANIPILADVREYTDEDGNVALDYSGHSMHLEDDAMNPDSQRIIYDEKVVGIVPETNNFEIVHDDETGNDYVLVDALLFRDYGNYCCDILESRGGRTDVSAEIACDEVAFSAKDKCLDVGKMQMCAITLLGDAVTPGMAKAHAEVFSSNEDDRQSQLIEIMKELTSALNNYTKESLKKGGTEDVDNEKFENEVTEPVEEVTDEVTVEEPTEEVAAEEEFSEDTESVTPDEDQEEVAEEEPVVIEENAIKYSIQLGDSVKEFSVSLSDIIYSLSELVNETYADECTYYSCDVYADDNYVIMVDYMTGKAYKQNYKCKKKHSYQLVGDRVPVRSIYVTEDEENKLNEMRSNYELITEKLEKYENEPQKMEILESDDYGYISETEEFAALKEQKNHFDLSIDEVKAEADKLLLQYAKSCSFSAIQNDKKPAESKKLPTGGHKTSRYGNLFKK